MTSFIHNWLRSDIQAISAYHVPKAQEMIKLDAMESPFVLGDELLQRYLQHLAEQPINRYPDPSADKVLAPLRALMGIEDEFGVLLGNGSDELIQLLALACSPGDTILSVEPSFVMYEMIAKFTHLNYQGVALNEDFELDVEAFLAAIEAHQPKLIFIAYPNNPTGNSFKRADIERIIESAGDALVVLDEAYYAYADDSFLADVARYENLVVLRTVSKIGFAGLRLGLMVGNQVTVDELNKLRLPYNINMLTQAAAEFLLDQREMIACNAKVIRDERTQLFEALSNFSVLQVYPSQANFILFRASDAPALFEALKQNGILIKNLSQAPGLSNCLRVTVGAPKENLAFIKVLEAHYGE